MSGAIRILMGKHIDMGIRFGEKKAFLNGKKKSKVKPNLREYFRNESSKLFVDTTIVDTKKMCEEEIDKMGLDIRINGKKNVLQIGSSVVFCSLKLI